MAVINITSLCKFLVILSPISATKTVRTALRVHRRPIQTDSAPPRYHQQTGQLCLLAQTGEVAGCTDASALLKSRPPELICVSRSRFGRPWVPTTVPGSNRFHG